MNAFFVELQLGRLEIRQNLEKNDLVMQTFFLALSFQEEESERVTRPIGKRGPGSNQGL